MTANEILLADHSALRKQIAEVQAALAKNPKKLAELYPPLQTALQNHFRREDSVYYRFLDEHPQRPDRELMHTLRNDHAAVLFTLESLAIRLRKNSPMDEWTQRFKQMEDVLFTHFDREERELFPWADQQLPAERQSALLQEIQNLA